MYAGVVPATKVVTQMPFSSTMAARAGPISRFHCAPRLNEGFVRHSDSDVALGFWPPFLQALS